MKHVVILGDGMADRPFAPLGGKTPLECAKTPYLDFLAARGTLGMAKTVPDHMPAGSDTANLSVLGYDPDRFYSGRSPFEAYSIGVPMLDTDISFRCNLVTLSEGNDYEELTILDHSSDEISTEEAGELLSFIAESLSTDTFRFFKGTSYRHILLWHNGDFNGELIPPHDILGKKIKAYLPKGTASDIFRDMMEKSYDLLKDHPVNKARMARGLKPANSIWIWGEGKKPALLSFEEKYGLKSAVFSAVDLIKGLGLCAGMDSIDVEGATGNLHTNFSGKADAAISALKNGKDFVYVHIEAPDECGHRFEAENKVRAIELIDEKVVGPIYEALKASGEAFRMMILPDHPTPLELRTHTHDPVPFLIYDTEQVKTPAENKRYTEKSGMDSGLFFPKGHELMDYFIEKRDAVPFYHSTRDPKVQVSASEAILQGISPEGGLFVPSMIPRLPMPLSALLRLDYKGMAKEIMTPYLSDFSEEELGLAVERAYDEKFDTPKIAPLEIKNGVGILELFHGPTLAFKDMALSILPHLLTLSAKKQGQQKEVVILTATSGDTGKAAMEGFSDVPGTRIIVFFPEDGVSDVQKKQMTTQKGENTHVIGIHGNFDDAQSSVKKIFTDPTWKEKLDRSGKVFSSANSINIGRLVPQIVYYFYGYKQAIECGYIQEGEELSFTVPTGNFGNILAGYYAKRMGLPISRLICASNENNVLTDFLENGVYDANRGFHLTSSPSMDILISSNLERLLYHVAADTENQSHKTASALITELMKGLKEKSRYEIPNWMKSGMGDFIGGYVNQKETSLAISALYKASGYVMDPHTAVAYGVHQAWVQRGAVSEKSIVLSTASPYKFCTDVLFSIPDTSGITKEQENSMSALSMKLSQLSGTKVPKSIEALENALVRHKTICEKDDMAKVIESILGITK